MLFILENLGSGSDHELLGVFDSLRVAIETAREVFKNGFVDFGTTAKDGGNWICTGKHQHLELRMLPDMNTIRQERIEYVWYKDCTGEERFLAAEWPDDYSEALRNETMALGEAFRNDWVSTEDLD